jgi:hypothetical protein
MQCREGPMEMGVIFKYASLFKVFLHFCFQIKIWRPAGAVGVGVGVGVGV